MNTNKKEINNKRFSVIGCGRVGVTLAVFLSQNGFEPAGFFSRTRTSARFARDMVQKGPVFDSSGECAGAGDIVFIATPDDRIEQVCCDIAGVSGVGPGSTVFHLSGALSSDILSAARDAGARTGSIHPLQAFTPYEKGQDNPFSGINMSVEGSEQALGLGKKIISALGACAFAIPTDAKTLYHASAVVASNYLVTLENFALELLMETGLDESKAYGILEPLIQGTLSNIKANGCGRALTGPVARGDDQIIGRHLRDIDAKLPKFSALYRLLGSHTLEVAKKGDGISKEAEQKLSRLFSDR